MVGGTHAGEGQDDGTWADGMPWRFIGFGGAVIALLMGWHLYRARAVGFAVPTPAVADAVAGVTLDTPSTAPLPTVARAPRRAERSARPTSQDVSLELESEALTVLEETDVVVSAAPLPAPQLIVVVQQAAPTPAPPPYPVIKGGRFQGAPMPHRRVTGANLRGLTPQRGALPAAPRANRAPTPARSRSASGVARRVSRPARPSSSRLR